MPIWNCGDETLHVVAQLVEALGYKPEGRGFEQQGQSRGELSRNCSRGNVNLKD
jgi:hypothetical protein